MLDDARIENEEADEEDLENLNEEDQPDSEHLLSSKGKSLSEVLIIWRFSARAEISAHLNRLKIFPNFLEKKN